MMAEDWEDRYWNKVDVRGEDDCWEWTACQTSDGYGQLWLNGKMIGAHRLAWELANGPIPKGLCVLHRCDHPACVNPGHLRLGSKADNFRDMLEKGRGQIPVLYGAENGRNKLTQEKIRRIRRLYATGEHLQRELGIQFGVSDHQVSNIVRRKHWAWLDYAKSKEGASE